jgi:hypothetical protein
VTVRPEIVATVGPELVKDHNPSLVLVGSVRLNGGTPNDTVEIENGPIVGDAGFTTNNAVTLPEV